MGDMIVNLSDVRESRLRAKALKDLEGCTSLSAERKEALAMVMTGWTTLGLGWWFWWNSK